MPYDHKVRLSPGVVIRIHGIVSHDPYRFGINLLACGQGDDRHNPFHFNVRFDGHVIVMNSREQGKWGKEERPGGFPFARGEGFVATIRVRDDGYETIISGQRLPLYRHRIPLDQVQRLFIVDQPKGHRPSLVVAHVSVMAANGQPLIPAASSVSKLCVFG